MQIHTMSTSGVKRIFGEFVIAAADGGWTVRDAESGDVYSAAAWRGVERSAVITATETGHLHVRGTLQVTGLIHL
jgi:hypothetical protein